jgi:exodeoxyribonuclease V gamma subunit
MTLSIFSSNRVESLQQNLCLRLNEARLSDPLASEIIVIPTYAMARWLNLSFAQQQGIAANFDYPLPAAWIWQLAASVLDQAPEQDPLKPEISSWEIFRLLPEMLPRPAFAALRQYLLEDQAGIKRWQLATRIADVFDRYQQYRPGLILDWSAGVDDGWQAQLWRMLIADHANTHRVAVIEQLIDRLNAGVEAGILPQRISLFAHSSLPPLFIHVIHALAKHTQVMLFQHSPTDQYWADLKNKKSLSKLRLENPRQAEYFESGNDLLASWGRQGQALQDLLLDYDDLPVLESEAYQAPGCSTLLQSVQQTIFQLDAPAATLLPDPSLSIHVCHSPMRECQVLKDAILAMLDQDPGLNPEEILVMIPEISRYAPYVEAVFRDNEFSGHPALRWNLSDITLADEHPLVRTFLQLLRLPGSRFNRSELQSYLDIEQLRQRFDIDETALADIISILQESRVRWGIDGPHKASLGLPPTPENTWQQASQRIFAGYALGDVEFWSGIAPIADIDAGRALNLGKFWLLFERLQYWRVLLGTACNSGEWQTRLNRMLDEFFVEKNLQEDSLQPIRDAINGLKLAGDVIMSPTLLLHWMEQQLGSRELQGRLFSGGITFCGMRPMRSLPFKVICLLGMNDGVFPRRESAVEFDLMAKDWLPGDPSKGDQDRYLMLETLLCARQVLYLSYCGRSLKDNSEVQPSVLLRELLDFVDSHREEPAPPERLSDRLTTLHPMQSFAAKNFSPDVLSYDAYWCRIANRIQQPGAGPAPQTWITGTITDNPDEDRNINLNGLRRFLQDPIKFFFNNRLKLWLTTHIEEEDEEAFTLDSLEKWGIKQHIAGDLLRGRETSAEELQAQGRLPHGYAAYAGLKAIQSELEPLLAPLQDYRGIKCLNRTIDCQLDDNLRLNGQVGNYYPGKGLMHFSSSSLKGKHLLTLWLDHLALCASGQFEQSDSSLLITRDINLHFAYLNSQEAVDQLRDYGELYYRGLCYPLPVFPQASYAWCCTDDPVKAADSARKKWYGSDYSAGDRDDNYVKLALRGNMQEPFASTEFSALAQQFYASALNHMIQS